MMKGLLPGDKIYCVFCYPLSIGGYQIEKCKIIRVRSNSNSAHVEVLSNSQETCVPTLNCYPTKDQALKACCGMITVKIEQFEENLKRLNQ